MLVWWKCAYQGERSHYRWLRWSILVHRAVYLHSFARDITIWFKCESWRAFATQYGYICWRKEIKATYVKLCYRTIHLKMTLLNYGVYFGRVAVLFVRYILGYTNPTSSPVISSLKGCGVCCRLKYFLTKSFGMILFWLYYPLSSFFFLLQECNGNISGEPEKKRIKKI
jgi:hypothetical protein